MNYIYKYSDLEIFSPIECMKQNIATSTPNPSSNSLQSRKNSFVRQTSQWRGGNKRRTIKKLVI